MGSTGRVTERRLATVVGGLAVLVGLSLAQVAHPAAADTTRGPNGTQQRNRLPPASQTIQLPVSQPGGRDDLAGLPTSHVPGQTDHLRELPTSIVPGAVNVAPGRVVIDGKGYGHGVGMAQDGALYLGKQGRTASQILGLFYPGTTLGKRGGMVRVPITSIGSLTVTLPQGGKVGGVAIPAGGSIRLIGGKGVVSAVKAASPPPPAPAPTLAPPPAAPASGPAVSAPTSVASAAGSENVMPFGGRFAVPPPEPTPAPEPTVVLPEPSPTNQVPPPPPSEPVTTLPGSESSTVPPASDGSDGSNGGPAEPKTTRAPGLVNAPTVGVTPNGGGVSIVGNKQYRGTLVFIAASSGMSVVNEIDVEQYLRGMGEVLSRTWPAASLQSQAIVARTYALREMDNKGQVCPTQKCQVYLGAQAEYPEMDAAVRASAGRVVMYEGKLAATFYSASGGGTIADPAEVFGPGISIPYLRAGTYPIDDPKAWRVELSMGDLARRFGYSGTLFDVVVSERGPSGRAVAVSLLGSKGTKTMTGPAFDKALNLRSTNFNIYVGRTSTGGTLVDSVPATKAATSLVVPTVTVPDSSGGESPLDYQSGLALAGASTTSPDSTGSDSTGSDTTAVETRPPTTIVTTTSVTTTSVTTTSVTTTVVTTTPPTSDATASIDVDGAPSTLVESAAVLTTPVPDTNSPIPGWAGWAAMGGIGVSGVWLALRWALRPEHH